ncbi:MAG TPA: lytic transglycosylase domain-containing protein [Mesorhizobium sp.]|nr:lytic transglycosylase domain-containing protein [Mesorhizobium sp.]
MPPIRRRASAILLSALALLPAASVSASVDLQTVTGTATAMTGAIGATVKTDRLKKDRHLKPFGPVAPLKEGLDAVSAGRIGAALQARDALEEGSLDRTILSWAIAYAGGGGVPSEELRRAGENLSDWPGARTFRRSLERALFREKPAPEAVIEAFAAQAPATYEGVVLLARAHLALGAPEKAKAVILPLWRREKLDATQESVILRDFGDLLTQADHRFRMERMFHAERVNAALRIAERAGAEGLADAWGAAIREDRSAQKLLDAVPAAQRSAGWHFAKAKLLRRKGEYAEAAAVMLDAPTGQAALADPDAWWMERRVLSRELLDLEDFKGAYAVAAGHAAESATQIVDAEFHAGWIALRFLDDPQKAAEHFRRLAQAAESPVSISRAHYWLGRTAESGGSGDAAASFQKAAAYGTTFYGQLAAAKLGQRGIAVADPTPTIADRLSFEGRDAVRAMARLEAAGHRALADALCRGLSAELTSPGEVALLAAHAERRGDHFLALKVGKGAAAQGLDIGALTHPVGAIPASADISGAGKALAYAIARQESEFNAAARSGAGALGLLQLLPGTAKEVARKAGLPFSPQRLTTDPAYNATLGAAFLAEQLGRFDGSYVLTFAGYNAGPRRAREWVERYGDPRGADVDAVVDWIERIPYHETRAYVQRVMENYQVYKMRLSGDSDIGKDLVQGR